MNANLLDLIDHTSWVEADLTLGEAFHQFTRHAHEYMAVLEQGQWLGLCSRQDLGMLLGTQYGFALFAQKPLRKHLRPHPVRLWADGGIREAFEKVFARAAETFYDDVVVLSASGQFLGLIFTQTLVKLQNQFHQESIRLLQQQSEEIALKNQQYEDDLWLSRELQLTLLPESYPVFPPGADPANSVIRFHHAYRPWAIVGGDFFHIQQISNLAAGVFIADVMGHGVRAALVTAMLRAMLEELGLQSKAPGELLTQLNHRLSSILRRGDRDVVYATALYFIANAATYTVQCATAGHPTPLHVRRRRHKVESLRHAEPGTVLGLFEDMIYQTAEWRVEPGDSILLFTDGIVEVENRSGEEFGITRLLATIGETLNSSMAQSLEQVIATALRHSANQQFTDDVCLLAIDFND